MKQTGFTLLELLIVVLIIGILASVAYPSFRLAIWKTRTAKLLPLGRSVMEQIKIFHLTNGHYPTDYELEGMLPARFLFDEHDSEVGVQTKWEDGNITVHCALGGEDPTQPATCDILALSIITNAEFDNKVILWFTAKPDIIRPSHSSFCMAAFPECELERCRLPHQICRALGGKPIDEEGWFYALD